MCRQEIIDYYFTHGSLPTEESLPGRSCGICDNCCGNTSGVLIDVSEDMQRFLQLLPTGVRGLGMTKTLDAGKSLGHKDYVRILLDSLIKNNFVEGSYHKWGFSHGQQGTLYRKKASKESEIVDRTFTTRVPEKFVTPIKAKNRKFTEARRRTAELHSVTDQNIMNDKVLANVRKSNPKSIEEMWLIDGVSTEFIGKYARDFLNFVDPQPVGTPSSGEKYYAVKYDQLDHIFPTWEECKSFITSNPGSRHKAFKTSDQANDWLSSPPALTTIEKTMELVREKAPIQEIARHRNLKPMTVENHIASYWGDNPAAIDKEYIGLTKSKISDILQAIEKSSDSDKLRPIMDNTKLSISWVQLKIIVNAAQHTSPQDLAKILSE